MAKLIVSVDGTVLQEKLLLGERTTIGRRPNNDIVLDNRAISGEHAAVIRSQHDHILEDLNSTNGTFVNGQPIKKHFLQDNDIIELVNYRIQYQRKRKSGTPQDAAARSTAASGSGTSLFSDASMAGFQPIAAKETRRGVLTVLNGPNAGHELVLDKETTTLGRVGLHLAALIRHPERYLVRHVEGKKPTLLNGEPVGSDPYPLEPGDVIDLSGMQVAFSLRDE